MKKRQDRIEQPIPLFSPDELPKSVILPERKTPELIIALVGPVGSGVTTTAMLLQRLLERRYKYQVVTLKISRDVIERLADKVGKSVPADQRRDEERIQLLQTIGTELREKFGAGYLAEKCVERIAIDRKLNGGLDESGKHPLPRRQAYIIDSLKNPAELAIFSEVYGNAFWVFGVFSPEEIRKQRLIAAILILSEQA